MLREEQNIKITVKKKEVKIINRPRLGVLGFSNFKKCFQLMSYTIA